MLHAALLAAALTSAKGDSPAPTKTPVHQCLESMDGAVYHGDPSDRNLMQHNVDACTASITSIERLAAGAAQGPEKLFILGRILDRAATLSYMGLDDAATALGEVRRANLYFRIASGLPNASAEFRDAALANVELTNEQLQTLHADLASTSKSGARSLVARLPPAKRAGQ